MVGSQKSVTALLGEIQDGNPAAYEQLYPLVKAKLREIARAYMARKRPGHTLETTVLIDEAYLQLLGPGEKPQNSSHFYRAAARAMRNILVDYERKRRAQKRGGDWQRLPIDPDEIPSDDRRGDVLAINEALEKLEVIDSRQGEIVELHHFGGYTLEETSNVLAVSLSTVNKEWAAAKAWLYREITSDHEPG